MEERDVVIGRTEHGDLVFGRPTAMEGAFYTHTVEDHARLAWAAANPALIDQLMSGETVVVKQDDWLNAKFVCWGDKCEGKFSTSFGKGARAKLVGPDECRCRAVTRPAEPGA
jgi:hypothetical protein